MSELAQSVLSVAQSLPEGGLLSPKEFLHLGTRAAVDQTLTRLTKEGLLLRVGRGVYALPVQGRFGARPPSTESVVQAIEAASGEMVVASGAAEKCEVQVAYAIGMSQPISILVETFGSNSVSEDSIEKAVRDVFDLRPGAIVRDLDLKRPIYAKTAAYGHFGRPEPEFTWETLSRLSDFKAAVKL